MTHWLASLRLVLSISLVLAFAGCLAVDPAVADEVPFDCTILPGDELASILITNSLAADASCIVTCKFSTTATPVDCKS